MTHTFLDTAELVRASTGRDPLTPRWEATVRAFYGLELRPIDLDNLAAGTRRTRAELEAFAAEPERGPFSELWARVGRRGRKSHTASLIAVHEAAFGGHEAFVLPNEKGLVAVISKDAAGSQLVATFAELYAKALGFETNWTSIGNVRILEIVGAPFGIACFPCSAKAPRGYAIPVIVADEIAHWDQGEDAVNSDESVLGAIKPAQAQFPNSKFIAISSPLGETGVFHDTVEHNLGPAGDDGVLAVEGPTWEWNPSITEARCQQIERDPEIREREFGAKPSGNEGTAFVPSDVDEAFTASPADTLWDVRSTFVTIDAAGSMNSFVALVGACALPRPPSHTLAAEGIRLYDHDGRDVTDEEGGASHRYRTKASIIVSDVHSWTGAEVRSIGTTEIVSTIAQMARAVGASFIFGDQFGGPFLSGMFSQAGFSGFRHFAVSNASKHEAVLTLRALMRDRQVELVTNEQLRSDLRTYPRRIVGSTIKYGGTASGAHHWDTASAMITLAHALNAENAADGASYHLAGAPTRITRARSVWTGSTFG